ncbi:MAG: hypothetical protein J5771_00545 [Bacteroidales bacterium]|nr:hypothetical protein [Bacteroidales bacterium]
MAKEDPLERIAREEAERKENGGLKGTVWVLVIIALALAGVLAYVWMQKSNLVGELETEKQELTEQIVALQKDYSSLSSEYESINAQLDSSREEVSQLVERIKRTQAVDRAKIRQYEKELGTLRSIMRNYIVQIDSLNTLNHKLTAERDEARRDAEEKGRRNEELSEKVENLSSRIAVGSVVKARGLSALAFNGSDKKTDRSSRVVRMVVTMTLLENELAEKGPMRIYIRVKDPEGILLLDGTNASFNFGGEALPATASREIDYQGQDVEISVYVNNTGSFTKGIYQVEAYSVQGLLGKTEILLR